MKGTITNEHDRDGLVELVNKLDLAKPYFWEVKRKVKRRTISANNLYWMWIQCLSEDTGNGTDALHEAFKQMFLVPDVVEVFGEERTVYSTKRLNTKQFSDYMNRIQAEAAGIGVILPTPDDLIFESFIDHYTNRV